MAAFPMAGSLVEVVPGERRQVVSLQGQTMKQETGQNADEEEWAGEKKEAGRGEEAGHLFLQKEGACRPTWSSLPPAAVSQE